MHLFDVTTETGTRSARNTLSRVLAAGFLCAGLLFIPPTDAAQASTRYDAKEFSRLPATSHPRLSPDGSSLAVIQPINGRRSLIVYALDEKRKPSVINPGSEGDVTIANYYWANNERLVVVVAYPFTYIDKNFPGLKMKITASRSLAFNKDGSNPVVLFKDQQKKIGREGGHQGNVLDLLRDDLEHILISSDANRDGFTTVNKINIYTGKSTAIARGIKHKTYAYATDWDGNVRLRFDTDDVKHTTTLYTRSEQARDWKFLSETKDLSQAEIDPIAFSVSNPDHLYIRTRAATGRDAIFLMDTMSGEIVEKVYEHKRVDVGGMSFFHDTHEPKGVHYYDEGPEVHFLSDRARDESAIFDDIFHSDFVTIYSRAREKNNRFVILLTGPETVPEFQLVDMTSKSVSPIGRTYPGLRNEDIMSVKPWYFKARDGLEIPAYVTLPTGNGPFPTIVLPHGGPRGQDSAEFDAMSQLFANRGYLVIQPNYRGSVGYGYEFEKAGFKQWGLKMQDDVTDATLKAIKDGIADPDRICIVGWSYGAYAAVMGAVKEPDLYKCTAAINGVYDLIEVMNVPNFRTNYHNYWGKLIGDKDGGDRSYMEHSSPAMRATEIKTPIFLAAGEIDRTVLPKQTRIMVKALKRARKKYEVFYYPHGNHSLLYEPERIDMFNKLDKFLARHLK